MDLKIKPNSRQIPKEQEICRNKDYYDILYSYLQTISVLEEDGCRYVYKKDVNFSKLAEIFDSTRQTISKKFKSMCDEKLNLITLVDDKKYRLNLLEGKKAMLIPQSTLRILNNTLKERAVSVYVYLLNRYYANDCNEFIITLTQIKNHVGLSNKSKSNNEIVTDILYVLKKLKLLDYRKEYMTSEDNSNFDNVKTVYKIIWVVNEI